ncbi:MAG: dehydrogenase, partial [Planctomycetales bacterium 12-60-4]
DAAGRLWFTQSIEYPWPVAEGQTGRDTIRVMSDTDNDGVPDKVDVFANGLNIPIGITPVYGGVLGYSIPTLYFFPDADGDGVADGRTEFYHSFGFRDTHGMCSSLNWWIDGWVYGCHGFANESEVVGTDGKPIKLQSGNTYRLKPDGSHIEYVTHGQVNPFGMCFDPLGNQYTSDCHTKPAYLVLRGAYYPSFGKPHDGLGYGPELLQHLHGSTGIAGIVYYAADHFPAEFRDNLIIGNPVTGRINRDTLEIHGSTYKAIEQPDFLTCDDPWFRPVDIQLAPDGSLYVADFYNRIIGHYEVPLTHPGRDRERAAECRAADS